MPENDAENPEEWMVPQGAGGMVPGGEGEQALAAWADAAFNLKLYKYEGPKSKRPDPRMFQETELVDEADYIGIAGLARGAIGFGVLGFSVGANKSEALAEADEAVTSVLMMPGIIGKNVALRFLGAISGMFPYIVELNQTHQAQSGKFPAKINQQSLDFFVELGAAIKSVYIIAEQRGFHIALAEWGAIKNSILSRHELPPPATRLLGG